MKPANIILLCLVIVLLASCVALSVFAFSRPSTQSYTELALTVSQLQQELSALRSAPAAEPSQPSAEPAPSEQQYEEAYLSGYYVGYSIGYDNGICDRPTSSSSSSPVVADSSGYIFKSEYYQNKYSGENSEQSLPTKYIGNENTRVFHEPTCIYIPQIQNRVKFTSRYEAKTSGYDACDRCRP